MQKSWLITLFSKFYPFMLIFTSAVAIIICAMIADQLVTAYYFRDGDRGKFLFGLLPALDENRQPVPDTELIKMSRGYIFFGVAAINIGILALIFRLMPENREVSTPAITLKLVAIFALLTCTVLTIPTGALHNMLIGNYENINLPKGTDFSAATAFFYAGVVAFAEGMFPIKVVAIANSHNRSDLPLTLATAAGTFTRWFICILASLLLLNKDFLVPGAFNFALIGVFIYAVGTVITDILECQVYI